MILIPPGHLIWTASLAVSFFCRCPRSNFRLVGTNVMEKPQAGPAHKLGFLEATMWKGDPRKWGKELSRKGDQGTAGSVTINWTKTLQQPQNTPLSLIRKGLFGGELTPHSPAGPGISLGIPLG